jgi:hypothetical protein
MRAIVVYMALCALGAVTASTALAVGDFTPGTTPAAITGEQKAQNVFEVTSSGGAFVKVKCSEARYEGTIEVEWPQVFLTPRFSSCTLGGLAATVRMNGCQFAFTSTGIRVALFEVLFCTAGKEVTIVKGNCTISIPVQAVGTVRFANEGGAEATMDALATLEVTTLKSTQTGSECPSPGLTSEDTRFVGTVTLKAFKDEGTREVTSFEHTYKEVICGAQVSFTVD